MPTANRKRIRILGTMTGTSADGLDLCLVEFTGGGMHPEFSIIESFEIGYPKHFQAAFQDPLKLSETEVDRLDKELGRWFASEISKLDLNFDLIGSHGQTIRHEPPYLTLQIGDPSFMSDKFKVPVVYDFRSRDVELGGQGAPLIPIVDKLLFSNEAKDVLCLNIGGISNLTVLPATGKELPILAWDTGPGNTLIDRAAALFSNYKLPYDPAGSISAEGKLNSEWFKLMQSHEFYSLKPPKSAGQEQFGKTYFEELLKQTSPRNDQEFKDLILCLTLLTAMSVTDSIKTLNSNYNPDILYLSGGGTKNKTLISQIAKQLPELKVEIINEKGVTADNKEAFGFAYLSYLRMNEHPGNIPSVTGAREAAILGKIYSP